jgi:hypothetical protein
MKTPTESEEVERRVAELQKVMSEQGLMGMVRHIQRTTPCGGDYTAERHALIGHLTLNDIFERMEAVRRRQAEQERRSPKA